MSRIRPLSEDLVNRIAAGEVIVRPENAVKELIENALDAGANQISITARQGGLQLLQVEDNGCGMERIDLALACQRFATSKIKEFGDLHRLETFGFRGEALSSLSQVANVSIVSRTVSSPCAYHCSYTDGRPTGVERPIAGLVGTIVTAENLFHNAPSRRKALSNGNEEMNRIANCVVKYAIEYCNVSFALKRSGSGADFRTTGNGDLKATVMALLGKKAGEDIIQLDLTDENLGLSVKCSMARPIASCSAEQMSQKQSRQKSFFLFINGRLVDCMPLKQALDEVFLAQDTVCSFILLSLRIDPRRVDVNVHPTKRMIYFLEQDRIIQVIQTLVETNVMGFLKCSRSVPCGKIQSIDSIFARTNAINEEINKENANATLTLPTTKKPYAHQMNRTDSKEQRLDEFLTPTSYKASDVVIVKTLDETQTQTQETEPEEKEQCEKKKKKDIVEPSFRRLKLISLDHLQQKLKEEESRELTELMRGHIFVGIASTQTVILQHSTSLYWVDWTACMRRFFYQIILFGMGNLGSYRLDPPAPINLLFRLANGTESEAEMCVQFLEQQSTMLNDYFALEIKEGQLLSLPSPLFNFVPQLEALPILISDLVRKVEWEQEEQCLDGICQVLSQFFTLQSKFFDGQRSSALSGDERSWKSVLKDVLFPAFKAQLSMPKMFEECVIRRLTDLPTLYKVFERC